MTLDLAPGDLVTIDGVHYRVEESSTFHETDVRVDLVRLAGPSPAHARWLLALGQEPYLMLLERLEQEWLAPPSTSVVHDGELFVQLAKGSAFRVRRAGGAGRSKEGRMDYTLFRANSGRVIFTLGINDQLEAWVGCTVPADTIGLPR